MNTGNTGFTATIITTAITTAFAVVAGIVNHIMSGNRDRENQQTTASLKYTEQQLEGVHPSFYYSNKDKLNVRC